MTSAGAEVIESKDNWNYSRSILFAWAIPYYHFGIRTSMPVSKTETIGVQVVNGWNNISKTNGGATIAVTSSYVKPKATLNLDWYGGPENPTTTTGYRNLFDGTFLLTPSSKFNAYVNYDYGQNRDALVAQGDKNLNHWQGVAIAAKSQFTGSSALAFRYEHFRDPQGFETVTAQKLNEETVTYEYKAAAGFLTRFEYRHDSSNVNFFHKNSATLVKDQNTVSVGFIAFFGPKR